jgi:hypothetical protein
MGNKLSSNSFFHGYILRIVRYQVFEVPKQHTTYAEALFPSGKEPSATEWPHKNEFHSFTIVRTRQKLDIFLTGNEARTVAHVQHAIS